MQVIILAAGMGRRLGSYTENNTKCMVEVNGVRLIDRLLTQLSAFSLNKVIIVVGYEGQKLIDYIGHRYDDKLCIEFVNNPIYDKTNNIYSLSLVKGEMLKDDTLLIESDIIFEDKALEMIIHHPYPNLALVDKYESWMDGTMVCIDNEHFITNFVPKKDVRYEQVEYYYKTVNIYKFSKKFSTEVYVPFLTAYCSALGHNEYYEQVLRTIIHIDKVALKALPIGDLKWYEIDDIQDLDIASTLFSSKKDMMKLYNMRYGGHWRYPKLIDYCYLVNPYFPTKRMKEELKANFDTLLTEYPSGMYVNSMLAAKYFNIKHEYAVVGNGAAELIKVLMEDFEGKIGVVYPTFQEYPNRKEKQDIIGYYPNNKDFAYSAKDLMDFYADKPIETLLLINPDNPSGNFIPIADVLNLIEWCGSRKIEIIVDESFIDFSEDYRNNSLFKNSILERHQHLIVVKSISKSYGVPGLRLGVVASGNVSLINQIRKRVSIWNINSFAEFYMQIYGKYVNDYDLACQLFIEERNRFMGELKKIPFLRVVPSQANYFMCEILPPYTSASLTLELLEKYDILIKDCSNKDCMENLNYVRLTVRNQEDNDTIIKALLELSKKKN